MKVSKFSELNFEKCSFLFLIIVILGTFDGINFQTFDGINFQNWFFA